MQEYDTKCDIWSCGIIMYIMLCGRPPFNADQNLEIMRLIKEGKYAMDGKIWSKIGNQAKDLIRKMLCYDPKKRITAQQALAHEWFKLGYNPDDPTQLLRPVAKLGGKADKENLYVLTRQEIQNALANMKTFKVTQKLKQATYAYIVTHLLTKAEKKPLARLFTEINKNNDGHLSKDDLSVAFQKYFGNAIDREDVEKMFSIIDVSGSG